MYVKLRSCRNGRWFTYFKVYILFVWLKFIKLSNHIRHCWSVVRVILYAESDKAMHEVIRPSTLNYLHHTRKMPIHWKLTYNHFTQKNSVAVDIQFCCLTDPQLFSDFRGCVKRCTWACGLGLNCKLCRTKIREFGLPLVVWFGLQKDIGRAHISVDDFALLVKVKVIESRCNISEDTQLARDLKKVLLICLSK